MHMTSCLLGLVSHATSLVRARWASEPHDSSHLPILPAAHAEEEAHDIALLLLVELLDVLHGEGVSEAGTQSEAMAALTL